MDVLNPPEPAAVCSDMMRFPAQLVIFTLTTLSARD